MANTRLEAYKNLIAKLLPPGKAWAKVRENVLLEGLAVELTRVEARAADCLKEIDPRQTVELLEDWESLLGIPDECTPEGQTVTQRQTQITQKLASVGGLSATYYEFIASQLGFDIRITDAHSFRVGRQRVGEPLTNGVYPDGVFRVGDRVGNELAKAGWRFYYIAEIPLTELVRFRVGLSRVGDPLVSYSNTLLECTLKRLKPAHRNIFFKFTGG